MFCYNRGCKSTTVKLDSAHTIVFPQNQCISTSAIAHFIGWEKDSKDDLKMLEVLSVAKFQITK